MRGLESEGHCLPASRKAFQRGKRRAAGHVVPGIVGSALVEHPAHVRHHVHPVEERRRVTVRRIDVHRIHPAGKQAQPASVLALPSCLWDRLRQLSDERRHGGRVPFQRRPGIARRGGPHDRRGLRHVQHADDALHVVADGLRKAGRAHHQHFGPVQPEDVLHRLAQLRLAAEHGRPVAQERRRHAHGLLEVLGQLHALESAATRRAMAQRQRPVHAERGIQRPQWRTAMQRIDAQTHEAPPSFAHAGTSSVQCAMSRARDKSRAKRARPSNPA